MQRITQITRGRPSRPLPRRSFYSHSSDYVTLGRQGEAVKRAVDIWVGDPHEAFVLVPKEIGKEMKTTIDEGTSSSSSFAAAVVCCRRRRRPSEWKRKKTRRMSLDIQPFDTALCAS